MLFGDPTVWEVAWKPKTLNLIVLGSEHLYVAFRVHASAVRIRKARGFAPIFEILVDVGVQGFLCR